MKKLHLVIIIIVVLVLGALVLFLSFRSAGWRNHPESTTDESGIMDPGSAGRDDTLADIAAVQSSPSATRYVSERYGFSFEKPEGYTVGSIKEGDGEMLVVQRNSSVIPAQAGIQSGFQIYITLLDEPMELTPNRIKTDLPGTTVKNPQKITLDGKGQGIMFSSNNSAFGGQSFEIWFTVPSVIASDSAAIQYHLFQITSYDSFAPELQKIIGTWKFQ